MRRILAVHAPDPLERPLALTLAAALVFIVANTAPLMEMSTLGSEVSTTIVGGAHQMWVHGEELTALAVAFCAVIAPAAYIAFMLAVLFAVRRARAPRIAGELLRWAILLRPWPLSILARSGVAPNGPTADRRGAFNARSAARELHNERPRADRGAGRARRLQGLRTAFASSCPRLMLAYPR